MLVCITIIDKTGRPRSLVFRQEELRVGRSSGNEIRLDPYVDIEVSRRHGVFRHLGEDHWIYEDLESTQGSFVNGRKVDKPTRLSRGDVITLGRNGPTVNIAWPVPRITGAEGTYLKSSPQRETPYFPLAFSDPFIDRFDSYERIGSGGFGEIWRAVAEKEQKTFAIKIMHPELLNPEYLRAEDRDSLIRRFVREAQITNAMANSGAPSIVPVHSWGDDPDRDFLYIVMDFIEGESLDKTIFRYEAIPERTACRYLLHIAEGLNAAHHFHWKEDDGSECHGVVHRDIKPNNILVEEASDRAWLVDFGIAGIQTGGERLTATSVRVGSHKFLSLEAMERNVIDPSLDLWAFAVTAYLLFSRGHFPYKGGESIELIRNMREGKLRPITHYRPDLSPALVDFLHRALDVNPAVRPKTAEEWIDLMRSLSEAATGA